MSSLWYLLLMLTQTQTHGARILGLFPVPLPSHLMFHNGLVFELISRGHHVTSITPFPKSTPIENYTEIPLKTGLKEMAPGYLPDNFFEMDNINMYKMITILWRLGESFCEHALSENEVQKLIHSKDATFDLVLIEAFNNECLLEFAHKFNVPVIQMCPYVGSNYMGDWVGSPNPYSYVPDEFVSYSDNMNTWGRMQNSFIALFRNLGRQLVHIPRQDAVMRKHFNYTDNVPHISKLIARNSLILLNSHFTFNYPRPSVPNYMLVGGLHIRPPGKLPEDLEKYMSEAPHGVIYFSMGTNLQSAAMPESKKKAFLEAFSKLKQKVLWKWETDSLPGQPSNVKLVKWLPQSDILAHPNVRLFITHGGLLSTQEAIS